MINRGAIEHLTDIISDLKAKNKELEEHLETIDDIEYIKRQAGKKIASVIFIDTKSGEYQKHDCRTCLNEPKQDEACEAHIKDKCLSFHTGWQPKAKG